MSEIPETICFSEGGKLFNPKDLFSTYIKPSPIPTKYISMKNIIKLCEIVIKIFGVALLPFFSFFIEIYYIIKTKGETISIFLNLDRIFHGKPVFSAQSIFLHICHFFMYFNLNSAMFFFAIINISTIKDDSLNIYMKNGLKNFYLTIALFLFYYLTFKIRPFNRNYKECGDIFEKFRNSFDMNFIQNIEFLGDFPENLAEIQIKQNKASAYKIAEAIDKSFKQNVEEFITNRFNSQKILMFCFGITQIINIFVIFYDYYTKNEMDLFSFITIYLYCFLNNFVFAGCFIYLYMDYTYSKYISSNKFLLDMIKYNKMEINWCCLKKEKKFPTLNFLDVDSLYLWNKLRKWNLKKTGEKKTFFIDLIIFLISLFITLIKIMLFIKIFTGTEVFFMLNSGILISLLIQNVALEIILLWKFFQGALANGFFQKYRENLFILVEDITFLRINFDKIQSLKRMESLMLTTNEKFYIYLFEMSQKNLNESCFDTIKKKLKDCELIINLIITEINIDEKVNQLKFGMIIPMNFTVLKSIIVTLATFFFTFVRLLLSK